MPQTYSGEFLAGHTLLRTRDIDEARHCVSQEFCDHKLFLASRSDRLSVCHNRASALHVSINYLHYGADVHIAPGLLDKFYLLQLPLTGKALVRHRGTEIVASSSTATLLNPDREADMAWQGNCRKLLLQIDKDFLQKTAEEILGVPLPGAVRFDPVIDLTQPKGQEIKELVLRATRLAEAGTLFGRQTAVQDLWAETDLISKLLSLQSSNISHIVTRAAHTTVPAGIRQALAYIHANLSESIRLADIARNAEMSVRTLQQGFRRSLGVTPMQALHAARLDAAHYQLTARRNKPSVTDVAFSNGFSHLGRFSRDYKNRFGHLPSQPH